MRKLLIRIDGAHSGEIQLRPGVNRVGRNGNNDCPIPHSSISGDHCEIYLEDGVIFVRDLGSTNGTFINNEQVVESYLQPDQVLRLGFVELINDDSPLASVAEEKQASGKASGLKVAKIEPPAIPRPSPYSLNPNLSQYPKVRPVIRDGGFFGNLRSAFEYPLRRDGLTLLIGGTALFSFLEFLQMGARFAFGGPIGLFIVVWLGVLAFGYLAAFMQKIIISSAQGDEDLPQWPEFEDFGASILQPALLVVGSFAASFGPAIAFWLLVDIDPTFKLMVGLSLVVFGCLYLPMALIATAMYDSLFALVPLLIVPSMVRVPKEYLLVCLILGVMILVRVMCEALLGYLLPIPILPTMISTFIALYFIIVEMRLLGLFYFFKEDELSWSF